MTTSDWCYTGLKYRQPSRNYWTTISHVMPWMTSKLNHNQCQMVQWLRAKWKMSWLRYDISRSYFLCIIRIATAGKTYSKLDCKFASGRTRCHKEEMCKVSNQNIRLVINLHAVIFIVNGLNTYQTLVFTHLLWSILYIMVALYESMCVLFLLRLYACIAI